MGFRLSRCLSAILLCAWLPLAAHADLDEIHRAAARGDIDAQLELGILYEFGFNMANNEVQALAWYMAAADGGNTRAAERRDILIGRLSSDQRAAAERRRAEIVTGKPAPARSLEMAPVQPESPTPPESVESAPMPSMGPAGAQ